MKKVLLFFANGTEEVEALTPVDLLRRAGAGVTVVGLSGKTQTGSHYISVNTDIAADELDTGAEFDMLVLPGGSLGTKNLGESEIVRGFIMRAVNEDKFLAAICAAPTILGKMGLLKGRKATCYPGLEKELTGALTPGKNVVCDGKIITGAGAGASVDFSLELICALYGADTAYKIKKSIVAE